MGVLCGLLGFALAAQVRSTQTSALPTARQEDLVRILDDLSAREDRLRSEIADLQATRDRISSGSDRTASALQEARQRAQQLGVLAGTVPAHGLGIVMTVRQGDSHLSAEILLDALEELRGAGAEAVQVNGAGGAEIRVGASTWFVDRARGVEADGTELQPAYEFVAIGDPPTLAAAMNIPGGVVDTVQRAGGSVRIEQRKDVHVTALRPLQTPQYARPVK